MATTRKMRTAAAMGAALALLVSGCGEDEAGGGGGDGGDLDGAELTVGAKEFTESKVLAQITAQALANAGATVDESSLSGSATVREALESDEIDMYWEYTGTGWVNILGNETTDLPEDLYGAVAEADEANGIAWLPNAPMNNTYAIAVNSAFAEENSLTTISDAATFIQENAAEGTICAASEFLNRDDGLPGLQTTYGMEFSEVVELDLGLVFTQLGDTCNFGEVFSTDGRIVSNDLTVLEDDMEFFLPYNAALTLSQETLDEYPAIADIMAPISEALTDEVITALNSAVDNDGETEEDVATQFLEDNGFLE